jgi:hypothetical protein
MIETSQPGVPAVRTLQEMNDEQNSRETYRLLRRLFHLCEDMQNNNVMCMRKRQEQQLGTPANMNGEGTVSGSVLSGSTVRDDRGGDGFRANAVRRPNNELSREFRLPCVDAERRVWNFLGTYLSMPSLCNVEGEPGCKANHNSRTNLKGYGELSRIQAARCGPLTSRRDPGDRGLNTGVTDGALAMMLGV